MADRYIDFFEVSEYGRHFIQEVAALAGLSPLVNIPALSNRMQELMDRVALELRRAGIERSDLRSGRVDVNVAVSAARRELERFHSYLSGLTPDVRIDRNAFFPGGRLGALSGLKPADLLGRIHQALDGFAVPANASFPERAERLAALTAARDVLAGAVSKRGGATQRSVKATTELTDARDAFVSFYSSVAKPLVRGLLNDLGRKDELHLFFLDLQVNEDGSEEMVTEDDPQPRPPAPSRPSA